MKKILILVAIFAVLMTALLITVYNRNVFKKGLLAKKPVDELYFTYTADEKKTLSSLSQQIPLTSEELFKWDQKAFDLVKKAKIPPTTASKIYAYLLVAEHDAALLSSHKETISPTASTVLCIFFPDDCASLQADVQKSPLSEEIAKIITQKVRMRIEEEKKTIAQGTPMTGDEYWNGEKPTTPDAPSWKPWVISSVKEFEAPPPPSYNSTEDLSQVEAVKATLASVTKDQKDALLYWAGGAGTETPAGIWLRLTDEYMKSHPVTLEKASEIRFKLATAMADSFIVCWHSKFTYWTKRPVMRDQAIQPFINTPNFPSYVSGHSTVSASAATVLSHYFPEHQAQFMAMAEEAKNSRLWGGIHFPVDNEEGFKLGQKVGSYVLSQAN